LKSCSARPSATPHANNSVAAIIAANARQAGGDAVEAQRRHDQPRDRGSQAPADEYGDGAAEVAHAIPSDGDGGEYTSAHALASLAVT